MGRIDVQLKRRYLVPNLVETVKGYVNHERGTLEAVTEARARAVGAQGPADQAAAENALTGALKSLFAVADPTRTCRRAGASWSCSRSWRRPRTVPPTRQHCNDAVLTYDNAVTTVPEGTFAAIFKFRTRQYFQAGGRSEGPSGSSSRD
jgi:LemA protein